MNDCTEQAVRLLLKLFHYFNKVLASRMATKRAETFSERPNISDDLGIMSAALLAKPTIRLFVPQHQLRSRNVRKAVPSRGQRSGI